MKKQFFSCLMLGTLIIGTTISYSMPALAEIPSISSNTLPLAGVNLILIHLHSTKSVKYTPNAILNPRFMISYDSPLTANDLYMRIIRSNSAIHLKNQSLVTVTAQDSAYNQNSQEEKAHVWQQQLTKTLHLVKITPYRS